MIKYVVNFDELIENFQQEIRNWVIDTGTSEGIGSKVFLLSQANPVYEINFQNVIFPTSIKILPKKTYDRNGDQEIKFSTSDDFEFRFPLLDWQDYSLDKLFRREIEEPTTMKVELIQPQKDYWEEQEVLIMFSYLDVTDIQFKVLHIDCFTKENGVRKNLKQTIKYINPEETTIQAPTIPGYHTANQEVSFEPNGELSQLLSIEYFKKANYVKFYIEYRLFKDGNDTGLVLKFLQKEEPYGTYIFTPDSELEDGKYVLTGLPSISIPINEQTDKQTYVISYEEV